MIKEVLFQTYSVKTFNGLGNILNISITEFIMKNIFTTSFLCNREPYLQSFNYKELRRFVAHKIWTLKIHHHVKHVKK